MPLVNLFGKENIVNHYDVVILLGSQIKFVKFSYVLAPHTRLKAEAAVIALKKGCTRKLIISGGYNFGVRYKDESVLTKPDFSFTAFSRARWSQQPSEAKIIADCLVDEFKIDPDFLLLEELSATTEENAQFVKIMLKRKPTFEGVKRVAILTLLYHMEKSLLAFKTFGLDAEPLFAEDLLASDDPKRIDEICEYYGTPKGGKQYDAKQIRQLLTGGESLAQLA